VLSGAGRPGSPERDGLADEEAVDSLLSLVSGVDVEFSEALHQIAERALETLVDADGVGITHLEKGRVGQLMSTNLFATRVDDVQYTLMQGPCVTAAEQNRTVLVPSLPDERRWPVFRAEVESVGLLSVMSLPLNVPDRLIGTLNVYARHEGVLDREAAVLGEQYALTAAHALQQASLFRQAGRLLERIDAEIERSQTVNRAVGMIMAQEGLDRAEAMAALQCVASVHDIDVATAAQVVWDDRLHRNVFLSSLRADELGDR